MSLKRNAAWSKINWSAETAKEIAWVKKNGDSLVDDSGVWVWVWVCG